MNFDPSEELLSDVIYLGLEKGSFVLRTTQLETGELES